MSEASTCPGISIKRALISVFDKTGVAEFARPLVEEFGIEIISTGGTASLLRTAGLPVTLVEDITGFPAMLDGRVKTLHPSIHAAILADRRNADHCDQLASAGIDPIDLVVVNLYPFEKTISDAGCTFEQAIEMIDIGGPCMLRAAAKNHASVLVTASPERMSDILTLLRNPPDHGAETKLRRELASEVFDVLAAYNQHIAEFLRTPGTAAASQASENDRSYADHPMLAATPGDRTALRYGENPHQRGWFQADRPFNAREARLATADSSAAKAMSFNNFGDADAALELCKDLARSLPTNTNGGPNEASRCISVFVKHLNPCGVGIDQDPIEAYRQAYLGDPNSAMGGILACNQPVSADFATAVMNTYSQWGKPAGVGGFFVEVWIAPEFASDAIEIIRMAKPWGERVRLVPVGAMAHPPDDTDLQCRRITGGWLIQSRDLTALNESDWRVVTKRAPTDAELADLRLAWLVCKHSRSNAITLCRDAALIGNGVGQMSRVMSCRLATWMAAENGHESALTGSVAASDAFFPFSDGPDVLMEAGVRAIIQPGGSKRDDETIAACDRRDVAMVFTQQRHFRH